MRDAAADAPGSAAQGPTAAADIPRDLRLDVFRGLALVTIFINHVPGTAYEQLTSRNFGFSDAAEAFVFMSGTAAGLAYSGGFARPPLWAAVSRVWARAFTLYMVHLTITLCAFAVAAGAALFFGVTVMVLSNNMGMLFTDPLGVLVGLPLMTHQLGYFNILPLYCVLLLATPVLLMVARSRPMLLLALSVAVWAAAGQFRLNFPNFPGPGGWFFNPLSWQLLFVTGLLTGAAQRSGRRFVPYRRWLVWVTGFFVVLVLVWAKWAPLRLLGTDGLNALYDMGLPFYLIAFDKTFLTAPRLLHILALAYLVSALPGLRRAAGSRFAVPLARLGQQALPVFAVGSLLALLMQSVKAGIAQHGGAPAGFAIDTLLIVGGIVAMLGLAQARHVSRRVTRRP